MLLSYAYRSSHHSASSPSLLQKITGPQLLLLNEKALTMLGVSIEFRRQTILQAVQELRVREFSAPRNFPEFKVRHRYCSLLYCTLLWWTVGVFGSTLFSHYILLWFTVFYCLSSRLLTGRRHYCSPSFTRSGPGLRSSIPTSSVTMTSSSPS